MAASLPRALGFVGLGSMGKSVASTLVRKLPVGISVNVYDANERVTKDFLSCHDEVVGHDDAAGVLQNSEMTFICVPTTSHTKSILSEAPDGVNNPTVVDLTSGAPDEVKEVAALAKDKGFSFMEAPLSGGPAGALAGTLTTFVAGPTDTYQKAKPLISLFSSNKFHLSETPGAGSATKSVNNCLNMMNLLSASEGLLSLAKFGVKAEDAVAAINNSSGRSLQTQVRIPKEVLSGEYNYGFFLKLMKKDVGIGTKFVDGDLIGKDFFSLVESLEKEVGGDEDYTASVKGLGVVGSKEAALNLLTGSGPKADPEAYMPSQIKLLVCDMAGTTVEEGGLVYQTLFNVLKEAGVDLTFDEIDAWHGAHKLKVVEHFVNRHEVSRDAKRNGTWEERRRSLLTISRCSSEAWLNSTMQSSGTVVTPFTTTLWKASKGRTSTRTTSSSSGPASRSTSTTSARRGSRSASTLATPSRFRTQSSRSLTCRTSSTPGYQRRTGEAGPRPT